MGKEEIFWKQWKHLLSHFPLNFNKVQINLQEFKPTNWESIFIPKIYKKIITKRCYPNVSHLAKWGIPSVFDKDVLEFAHINKNKILVYVLKTKTSIFCIGNEYWLFLKSTHLTINPIG